MKQSQKNFNIAKYELIISFFFKFVIFILYQTVIIFTLRTITYVCTCKSTFPAFTAIFLHPVLQPHARKILYFKSPNVGGRVPALYWYF